MTLLGTVKELWRYPVKAMGGERVHACAVAEDGLSGDRHWALRDELRREVQSCKLLPQLLRCEARYRGAADGGGAAVDITFPDGTVFGSDDPDIHMRLSGLIGRAASLQPRRPASESEFYRRYKATHHDWRAELMATFEREPGEPGPDLTQLPPELVEHVSTPGTLQLVAPLHLLTTATLDHLAARHPRGQWDARRFRPNVVIETVAGLQGLAEQAWAGRRIALGAAVLACTGPTLRCGAITRRQRGLDEDSLLLRTVVRDADQNVGVYAGVERTGAVRVGDPVQLLDA